MKNIFSDLLKDDTMLVDEEMETIETMDDIDPSFDVESTPVMNTNSSAKPIVKVYEPVTKNSATTVIDSIKHGELCIVNFNKIPDEEAKQVYATLAGAVYSLEGQLKMIDSHIMLCVPKNFLVDGDLSD